MDDSITLAARTLAGVRFAIDGRSVEYENAHNLWGVTDGAGRWLSFDGDEPYTPRGGRTTAEEVAATVTISDSTQWIEEVR